MVAWGAIGLGVQVLGGLWGANRSSNSARDAADAQNEAMERQFQYDTELHKLSQERLQADRQQAVDAVLLQAENEKKIADYKDASNLRNYQYNLQIRDREQESLDQQYLKSNTLYHSQIGLNTLAERTAQDNEYRKFEDIQAESAFDAEEARIEQLQAEGRWRARGVKGGTAEKGTQVTYADLGRVLSQINESQDNAGRMARAVLEEISQDKVSADLAAFAQKMLPPGTLPDPLMPISTPRADFQMPRALGEYDFGPDPVRGAYTSPNAAANRVWGSTISSVAGNVGQLISTFK